MRISFPKKTLLNILKVLFHIQTHWIYISSDEKAEKKFCLLCFSFPLLLFKFIFFPTPIWKKDIWVRNLKNKGKLKTEKEFFFCAHLQRNNKSRRKHKGQDEATLITELWITWHYWLFFLNFHLSKLFWNNKKKDKKVFSLWQW